MLTRRDFGKATVAGFSMAAFGGTRLAAQGPAAVLAAPDSTVRGVKLGAITGVLGPFQAFRGQDVIDVVIERAIKAGVQYVELVGGALTGEPGAPGGGVGGQAPAFATEAYLKARAEQRQWRLNAPLDRFAEIRRKFDTAGLNLYSYVVTIGDDFTDPEIDAVFRHMQALKVDKFCTNQNRVAIGRRMAPYAEKYKIRPAFHTHAQFMDPNEVASVESLETLFKMSPMFMVNLDIGHFTNGGGDAIALIKKHPTRITHLHVRDSRKGGGAANIGEGDIGVAEILRLIRDNKWDIGCILEQGRTGFTDSTEATKANIDYMRKVLES
jgi:sugar phosphate isomerase/epimerase